MCAGGVLANFARGTFVTSSVTRSVRRWQCTAGQSKFLKGLTCVILRVQIYGVCVAVLNDDMRITKLEVFYGMHVPGLPVICLWPACQRILLLLAVSIAQVMHALMLIVSGGGADPEDLLKQMVRCFHILFPTQLQQSACSACGRCFVSECACLAVKRKTSYSACMRV